MRVGKRIDHESVGGESTLKHSQVFDLFMLEGIHMTHLLFGTKAKRSTIL